RIGVLVSILAADDPEWQARGNAFVQSLQERGWSDGRNVRIEYRWGLGDQDRLRKYAAELVSFAPDVILAAGYLAAAGDQLDSHRYGGGQRSRRARLRFKLGASGREHHRLRAHQFPNGGEVAGDAQRGRPRRFSRCTHVQPGHGLYLLRLSAFIRGRAAVNRSRGGGGPCSQHRRNRR